MISFESRGIRFQYRVAAVIIENDRVLLQKVEGEEWWFLPGGRAEAGETARDALRREMREELDAEVSVGRLLWVVENFFRLGPIAQHEVGLYFAATLAAGCARSIGAGPIEFSDGGSRIVAQWHGLHGLPALSVRPAFLTEGLRELPVSTEHVVSVDAEV